MSKCPRLVFVLGFNWLSGGNNTIYAKASYLADFCGAEVSLYFIDFDAEVSILHEVSPRIKIAATDEERKRICSQEHDIVFFTFWSTCLHISKFQAKKFVYFVQSDERKFYTYQPNREESKLAHLVEATYKYFPGSIITVANWLVDLFSNEFNRPAYLSHVGVDLNKFHPSVKALSPTASKPRVLVEGPINFNFKRIEFAQMCIAPFRKHIEVWHIANDGIYPNYWYADRVFSKLHHSEMPSLMRSCDFILKLSVVEGCFLPPLEMFACAKTALSSDVTGSEDFMVNEVNSLIVRKDNYDETVNSIERLISNKSLLGNLSEAALETAMTMGWDRCDPRFADVIKIILADNSTPDEDAMSNLQNCIDEYTLNPVGYLDGLDVPLEFDKNFKP